MQSTPAEPEPPRERLRRPRVRTRQVTLRLSEQEAAALERLAHERMIPRAALAREAVQFYLRSAAAGIGGLGYG